MRVLRTFKLYLGCPFATLMICAFFNPAVLSPKEPPSDICTLLTAGQLQKILGQPFGMAERGTARAAYRGQPNGTVCEYKGRQAVISKVVLIAYVDSSPSQAKETYDKLSNWFGPKTKPVGVGDSGYIDNQQAIHVLKGQIRYYIKVTSSGAAASEKQLIELASLVASEL